MITTHHPKFSYSGITAILDKPSRFDKKELISGNAGQYFDSSLLAGGNPMIHRATVEIRTCDVQQPFLPNTKVLLLMGEASLRRWLPGANLHEYRGCPLHYNDLTLIPTYAPQDANDRYDYFSSEGEEDDDKDDAETAEGKTTHGRTQRKNWRFWMRQDIRKAVRLLSALSQRSSPSYHYYPDLNTILHLLYTNKRTQFYFDIETDSNLQLTCFGFSLDEGANIYVVPMLQTHIQPQPTYYYGELNTALLLRALAVALRDNTAIIHNACFDLFVLAWRYGIPLGRRVYDTMLAHNRCYIEVEKSLGHCISLYSDTLPYHKNEGIFEPRSHIQAQQLYEYNGKDVLALVEIKKGIDATAVRLKAVESVEQVNRMVIPYLTMTLQGIRLDTTRIAKVVDYHERFNIQIKRILHIITGYDFNPNSWQQVSAYLYDNTTFKIPKPAEDPTNEKTLLQLLLKYDVPAIHAILKYRGNQKRISKAGLKSKKGEPRYYFGLYTKEGTTPRITTSWRLGKTITMRLGSSKLLRRWGDNLQNWEEELRKEITPDYGKGMLQLDQAGAEALHVAYLCRAGQFRDIFLCGINPHSWLAMHIFAEQFEAELGYKLDHYRALPVRELVKESKWPEIAKCCKESDKWPAERRYYFMAKQGNHSLNYDAKARAFRLNTLVKSGGAVALSMVEAQKIIDVRQRLFPEIQEWQRDLVMEVRRTGILRNAFGHPRVITGIIEESKYKEYYAFPPQSTIGQITNYAITELQERLMDGDKVLEEAGLDILQNNHDSILAQCYPSHKEAMAKEIARHMNRRLVSPRGEEFYMKTEAKWSESSWGEMEILKLN